MSKDLRTAAAAAVIDDRYDIKASQLDELKEIAKTSLYDALTTAFNYGFVMGDGARRDKAKGLRPFL